MNALIRHTRLALPLCAFASFAAAQSYTLVDLGTIHGESHAFALAAAAGQTVIAGSSTGPSAHFQGVRYAPTPTGFVPPVGYKELALLDVAADGTLIGTAYNLAGMQQRAIAVSPSGTTSDLGAFVPRAINAAGDIAGTTTVVTSTFGGITLPRACTWHAGTLTLLPTLGGQSAQALALDDAGRVGGSSMNTGDHVSRPCLWVNGSAIDAGTLGGTTGQIYAIRGTRAVGLSALASGLLHATLWNLNASGTIASRVDLGGLPASASSIAHAVNAAGDIVGNSAFRAVLWRAGVATDLNTLASKPGWVLENAWDIDDNGQIVGTGSYYGVPRAFLLRPHCAADFNTDGFLDFTDFDAFVAAFEAGDASSDFNADGFLDFTDFDAFVVAFEAGC